MQELKHENTTLALQVEGSIRSNHELENYLENAEVSQARFGDKQKTYNRKIQELNKRNQELRDANVELENRL